MVALINIHARPWLKLRRISEFVSKGFVLKDVNCLISRIREFLFFRDVISTVSNIYNPWAYSSINLPRSQDPVRPRMCVTVRRSCHIQENNPRYTPCALPTHEMFNTPASRKFLRIFSIFLKKNMSPCAY